jgi:peptidoglycan/xylan/chitin deacetylase (PgdA/CDA1 family)
MSGFEWPNGCKVAVCLTWDMDGEAAHYYRNPEQAMNQVSELVQRSYGPRVGIWKVLDLLDKYDIRGTFYVPGYTANLHPEVVQTIVERKHSLGLHGYLHETMDDLNAEQESEMFENSIRSLERVSGIKPRIFRSPSFELNRRTPELLLKNGVLSDSSLMGDDFPYFIDTDSGSILELPVQWILDDFEFVGHTKSNRQKPFMDPDSVLKIWEKEFEGLYLNGGIFVLTLHPFVTGRWVFIDMIEKLIKHITKFKDVWIATMVQVTEYCQNNRKESYLRHLNLPESSPRKF